ncbi:unnamed protein product, partial [Iphiclides podalirius]
MGIRTQASGFVTSPLRPGHKAPLRGNLATISRGLLIPRRRAQATPLGVAAPPYDHPTPTTPSATGRRASYYPCFLSASARLLRRSIDCLFFFVSSLAARKQDRYAALPSA